MADESDVPPLEDMTEVLKQVEAIREGREGANIKSEASRRADIKSKAKVKKNPSAKAVSVPASQSGGDCSNKVNDSNARLEETSSTSSTNVPADKKPPTANTAPSSAKSSGGMFGGMKKGFLFGGPSKPSGSSNKKVVAESSSANAGQAKKQVDTKNKGTEEIPYITPSGTPESALSFDDVQQAMSEAKGLLDNKDWITDNLLNKIEKNEFLVKRFGDAKFMQALEEFQTNPQAAMEKYKSNAEVEKFLQEFCGLLGDHFTQLGDSSENPSDSNSKTSRKASNPIPTQVTRQPPKQGPKITEIDDNEPKIVEITEDSSLEEKSTDLPPLITSKPSSKPKISEVRTTSGGADISEVPPIEDPQVKEVLNDKKVMEVLMDPKIMNLIQALKSAPEKAQRLIDDADSGLREKINFLVSKGLLKFQAG